MPTEKPPEPTTPGDLTLLVLREIRLQLQHTNECMGLVTHYIDGLSGEVADANREVDDLRSQMVLMTDQLTTVLGALVSTIGELENKVVGPKKTMRTQPRVQYRWQPGFRVGGSRGRRAGQ
jgi:hypothetical protein